MGIHTRDKPVQTVFRRDLAEQGGDGLGQAGWQMLEVQFRWHT